MNYMKQVAEMLGVEMGERFKIGGFDGDFYFSNLGINDEEIDDIIHSGLLQKLLDGTSEIIKKPWKPKYGDTFYYVSISGTTVETRYTASMNDVMFLYMGNCFRTEEDAKAHRDEIMAKFKAVMDE